MKKYLLLLVPLLSMFCARAQNIVKAEYFVDSDPGIGAATDVPITPSTSINNKTFSVDLSAIGDGFHQLYFRVEDANGVWSATERTPFYRLAISSTGPPPAVNITNAEYYIDSDPGIGSGTSITMTPGLSVTNLAVAISVDALADGFHQLYVRFNDANGVWSTTERTPFYKLTISGTGPPPAVNITKAEYYIDTDPGIGAATNISITAGQSVTDLLLPVSIGTLTDGLHQLYVRFNDANGIWSTTERTPFYKLTISGTEPPPPVNITEAEYFIDTDPGIGAGTTISITSGLSITNLLLPITVSSLAEGTHKLFTRFKDANGVWSTTESTSFAVCNGTVPTASAGTDITTSGFTANWATVTDALSYQLDVSSDNFVTFESGYNSKSITAPSTSAAVSVTSQATIYQYRVRAVVTCASVPSSAISVTVPVATPSDQPINIVFSSVGTTTATVTYTPPGTPPTGYLVVRRVGSSTTFVPTDNVAYTIGQAVGNGTVAYAGANALLNETGLTANTNYFYTVYAYNQLNGLTSYLTTSPLSGNTFTLATEPTEQATNMQFTNVTSTSYTVGYTAATGSPAGYLVLRKVGSAPTSVPVDGTSYTTTVGTDAVAYQGGSTSFAETSLVQNTNYYYAVYTFNGSGTATNYFTSSPLQGNTLTPITPPSSPATNMIFSSVTPSSITVSYTIASGNPSGYVVVRKVGVGSTFIPQPNTTYTIGQTVSDGTIAYVGSGLSFTDAGLTASTTYFYDVFAYNQISTLISYQTVAPLESSKSTFTAEPIAQPTSISFSTITTTSITLTFVAANPAPSGYLVLRKAGSSPNSLPTDGNPYSVGNSIGDGIVAFVGSAISGDDTGLIPGTTYFYTVFSYNGSGTATNYLTTASSSNSGSVITIPDKPMALSATSVEQNQFTANWSATTGAASYQLDISSDNFATMLTGFNNLSVSSTSINVTGLTAGITYQYRVRALNVNGTSVNSDPITQITVPGTPTLTTATNVGLTGFTANWSAIAGATGYYIDVSLLSDFSTFAGGYQNVLLNNVTALDITGLIPGTSYFYQLRSTNAGGTSPSSSAVTQLLIPGIPITLDATNSTSTSFKAKWQAVTSATEYRFDVSVASDNFNPSLSAYTDVQVVGALEFLVTNLIPNTAYKYRVRAVNATGASPNSSPISVSTLDASTGNNNITTSIPTLSSGGTLENYTMFSIPLVLADSTIKTIFNSLGSYSKDKWRLLRWNQSKGSWDEFNDGLTTLDRGKSYWFNTTLTPSIVVTGVEFANPSFSLTLVKGWNQIGSPFNFDVSWTDVLASNSSNSNIGNIESSIYKYIQSPPSFAQTDNVKAWSGNFVFNKGDNITVTISQSVKHATGGRIASNSWGGDLTASDWFVPLTLNMTEGENSYSGFGMHSDANASIDKYDGMTVPRFMNYVELNSYHPEFFEKYFSRDVVTTSKNFNWHFMAESNAESGNAILSWDNQALGVNSAMLILYDPITGSIVDMKQSNQYSFQLREKHPLYFFYASDKDSFQPDITSLASAYPNPTSTSVTFPFFTSTSSEVVQIEVYDMMGKKVKTVVNGLYEPGLQQAQWDATDDQGTRVAQGVYIYRFVGANNVVQSGKLVIR